MRLKTIVNSFCSIFLLQTIKMTIKRSEGRRAATRADPSIHRAWKDRSSIMNNVRTKIEDPPLLPRSIDAIDATTTVVDATINPGDSSTTVTISAAEADTGAQVAVGITKAGPIIITGREMIVLVAVIEVIITRTEDTIGTRLVGFQAVHQ